MAPIRISSSQGINDDQLTHCHIVPCKIHYSGPAKVSKYFNVKSHNGQPVSYFRGRKLLGQQINLDEKYIGKLSFDSS